MYADSHSCVYPSISASGNQGVEAVHSDEFSRVTTTSPRSPVPTCTTTGQLLSTGLWPSLHRLYHQTVWVYWGVTNQVSLCIVKASQYTQFLAHLRAKGSHDELFWSLSVPPLSVC